MKMTVR